jgi:hypothetical protein
MRNALMQVVHDIQMLKNNVTLHEEGKKYPMPIIKNRKASLQVLRRRYQNSLSLSLSLSVVRPEKLQRKKSQYMGMIRHGHDYSSCDFILKLFLVPEVFMQ